MTQKLDELSNKIGIATTFSFGANDTCHVSDELLEFLCCQFGMDVSSPKAISKSCEMLDNRCYDEVVAPIYVMRQNGIKLDIYVLKGEVLAPDMLKIKPQGKAKFRTLPFEAVTEFEKDLKGQVYQKIVLNINENLDIGYYELEMKIKDVLYHSVLAVAPEKCYVPQVLKDEKIWGFTLQLYSLKSKRNWGVGDFTDLKNFATIAAKSGADIIGLNPINVLSHDFPENASPYASISRFFLNPIYIDVEKTAGFDEKIKGRYAAQIAKAKESNLIDYTNIYNIKINALHDIFVAHKKPIKAFENYKKSQGKRLHLFALYQAIYHEKCKSIWGGWRAWPEGLKNLGAMDLAIFEQTHQKEIEFFKFLQFEAARQFEEAAKHIKSCGLKIGLYRDLPVGVSKDSAELWSDRNSYIKGSGAGAPPDAFFPQGQKWCLGAFDPFELRKQAYEPFLKILRANMAYAGALRMDHVMSLMRLFMIKDDGDEGTYIYYNFEDMLALVALESHLNNCLIVGESIGNVPDGFVDTLQKNDIYSMSVLWAERWCNGCGDFKAPQHYPSQAFVSVGTHDMPPLKMWWFGYEIELKYKLKMIDENERRCLYQEREKDRWLLLKVLDENGVWPSDNLRKNNYIYGESYPEGLTEAVHTLIAKSQSKVVILQLEDILGVDELQNLPGTDRDKYPNWRHKLPLDLEDLENNVDYIRNIKAVKSQR
ncbi:MAG: 4-alpha-glucanotransferase [Alphaproteobacteria bacterium]|nr:4-alpha-glucanotransferase [Alphaproteobacteria bacterium]